MKEIGVVDLKQHASDLAGPGWDHSVDQGEEALANPLFPLLKRNSGQHGLQLRPDGKPLHAALELVHSRPPAIATSSPAVLVPPVGSPLSQLAGHSLSQEVGAVKVVDSVVRVTVVLKLDECIPDRRNSNGTTQLSEHLLALDQNVFHPAVFPEKPFHILLPGPGRDSSQVDSG